MNVFLISPPNLIPARSVLSVRAPTPSTGIPYLVASLRQAGHTVSALDALGEGLEKIRPLPGTSLYLRGLTAEEIAARVPESAEIIGLSCMFSNEWIYCKDILSALSARFPRRPLLVGGEHVTADTEYVLRSAPGIYCAVLGEGEATLREVVGAIGQGRTRERLEGIAYLDSEGRVVRNPPRGRIRPIDQIPWPAWDVIPLENYFALGAGITHFQGRIMPLLASRGCPYECTFCSNPSMWGLRWISRDPEDVVAEMKRYIRDYRVTHFEFHDLTAIVNRKWILAFTALLIEENLGVTWSLPSGTRSEALDREVVESLYRSGCKKISYAPESGSEQTLARIKKKVRLKRMEESMRWSVRTGILVRAHIILGFPEQTLGEVWDSLRFIFRMACIGVHDVSIYFFVPYPGSELFAQLKASGRIPSDMAEYERFLTANLANNAGGALSWSEHLSDRQLKFFSFFGMGSFYLLQFLLRPGRLFGTLGRFFRKQPATILDGLLHGLFHSKATQMQAEAT